MAANTKWKPTGEQREIIEGLIGQASKEQSHELFVKRFLPFGAGQWSAIIAAVDDSRAESYFDRITDRDGKMEELKELLVRIQLQRASDGREDSDAKVIPLSQFRAVQRAVKEAKLVRGPERLIKYLAPTGGGKTWLSKFLATDNNLRVVESRDAWRRSYYCFLLDICRAVGLTIAADENSPAVIEDKLIPFLCAKEDDMAIVLYIDEGEFFGREALNGLKLLLNKTRMVPVVGSIPQAHDRWNRYFPMESDQIARRTREVIQLSVINEADCKLFFPPKQFSDSASAVKYLAGAASKFGHYSLLKRVARKLAAIDGANHDDVQKATESALTTMRRLDRISEKKN
jgi:hypothetical protein